jgi:hypothetical protein
MLLEKKRLSLEEMESQTALELPDRELMLLTVVIADVANNLSVDVNVRDVNVAAQVCAAVQAINGILVGQTLSCFIQQR